MAEVNVRWVQSVAGRHAGYEETVERTEFIDGCAKNNRLVILAEIALPTFEAEVEAEVARPRRLAKSEPFKLADEPVAADAE